MKPQQTVPLLTTLAPLAAAAPPIAFIAIVGAGLLWLLSDNEKPKTELAATELPQPPVGHVAVTKSKPSALTVPAPVVPATPAYAGSATIRRITREDLAEALAYGARQFTRREAVAALEALGFRKTAAYKALTPYGKFASFIENAPDGLIEWRG